VTNESALLRLLQSADWYVRLAAVMNHNATEQVLLTAVQDEWLKVRLAAAANPNATEPVFKRTAIDRDERVRNAVTFSDKTSTITRIIGAMGVLNC